MICSRMYHRRASFPVLYFSRVSFRRGGGATVRSSGPWTSDEQTFHWERTESHVYSTIRYKSQRTPALARHSCSHPSMARLVCCSVSLAKICDGRSTGRRRLRSVVTDLVALL